MASRESRIKQNPEFVDGSIKHVIGEHNVIGFGRMRKGECSLVIINNGEEDFVRDISVWHLGTPMEAVMERLMLTTADGYDDTVEEVQVIAGKVLVSLPRTSAIVLKYRPKCKKNFLHFE